MLKAHGANPLWRGQIGGEPSRRRPRFVASRWSIWTVVCPVHPASEPEPPRYPDGGAGARAVSHRHQTPAENVALRRESNAHGGLHDAPAASYRLVENMRPAAPYRKRWCVRQDKLRHLLFPGRRHRKERGERTRRNGLPLTSFRSRGFRTGRRGRRPARPPICGVRHRRASSPALIVEGTRRAAMIAA